MKRTVLAVVIAAASAVPALAQDYEAMVCSEYNEVDNAGKNAIAAELQSEAGGMGLKDGITAEEIFTGLAAGCADAPEIMIVEVVKGIK